MNEKDFKDLEDIAQGVKMNPNFKATLEAGLREDHALHTRKRRPNKRWFYPAAILALTIVFTLVPLSVLAQQIIATFFVRLSTDNTINTINETPATSSVWFEVGNIAEAETALGVNLSELTLPSSYTLEVVSYTSSPMQVTASYSGLGRNLVFTQGQIGWTTGSSVGSSATISQVDVLGTTGEYVEGFWINEGQTNQWRNNSPFRRLRWQSDEMQYEIFATGGSEDTDNLDLVLLAENLR